MGSSPSRSKVKPFSEPASEWEQSEINRISTDNQLSDRISDLESQLEQWKDKYAESTLKCSQAEDMVHSLKKELETLEHRLLITEPPQGTSSTSSRVQDKLIENLEQELLATKQELLQTRQKHSRKLEKVRSSSAKSQAESALFVFELKHENQQLSEHNKKLLEQVHKIQTENAALSGVDSAQSGANHMSLILELSQQVSVLDEELKAARKTISKMGTASDVSILDEDLTAARSTISKMGAASDVSILDKDLKGTISEMGAAHYSEGSTATDGSTI